MVAAVTGTGSSLLSGLQDSASYRNVNYRLGNCELQSAVQAEVLAKEHQRTISSGSDR